MGKSRGGRGEGGTSTLFIFYPFTGKIKRGEGVPPFFLFFIFSRGLPVIGFQSNGTWPFFLCKTEQLNPSHFILHSKQASKLASKQESS